MQAIGYVRVSSRFQGVSGLGVAAQAEAVERFCGAEGLELVAIVREVRSGRRRDRRGLHQALELARELGAVVVAARLDRLYRDARAMLELLDSGVPIRFADQPNADRCLLTILAAVAEREALHDGQRTKAALQAARSRDDVRLGSPDPSRGGRARGAELQEAARAFAERLRPVVEHVLREDPGASVDLIGSELERRGIATPRGRRTWARSSVYDLLARLEVQVPRKRPSDAELVERRRRFKDRSAITEDMLAPVEDPSARLFPHFADDGVTLIVMARLVGLGGIVGEAFGVEVRPGGEAFGVGYERLAEAARSTGVLELDES
ncbi:MAG: recombinase family protein [Candidatus Rokubacteria bacterium]|nr:recombinase family protein [Candidatus Rokubacteria bacterium]